jgi:cytochrome P450
MSGRERPEHQGLRVPPHVPSKLVRDFDYFKLEAIDDDIHLAWRRLQEGPAFFYTPHNGGHWVATRAEDIEAIFLDPVHFSSREATIPVEGKPVRLPLLEVDPPEHTAWRQLLIPLFSPKAIGAILLEEWLKRIPDFWIKPGDRVEVRSGKVNAISRLPLAWQ